MSMELLDKIAKTLQLPLSEYHRLKLVLNHILQNFEIDRCSLLFPCDIEAQNHFIVVEQTTPQFPGANELKCSDNPIFKQICEQFTQQSKAIDINLDLPTLQPTRQQYQIKNMLVCYIDLGHQKSWALVIQHCQSLKPWSSQQRDQLEKIAIRLKPSLTKLLDLPTLLRIAETETQIIDNSPVAQAVFDMDRRLVYANSAYCLLNGRSLEEIIGFSGKKFLNKESLHQYKFFFNTILSQGKAFVRGQKIHGDNKVIHVENQGSLIHFRGEKHYLLISQDITNEVESTEALQSSLQIQKAIMEATDDAILVEDNHREIISINQNFIDAFNLPNDVLNKSGQQVHHVLEIGMPAMINAEKIRSAVLEIENTPDLKTSHVIELTNGRILDLISFPLFHKEELHGRVWYFKDTTEKVKLTKKLSFEATHDSLTKLINRRGFDEQLRTIVQETKNTDQIHALLYLDLDNFKIINDSSGHGAGDAALIDVSQLLQKQLRSSDILARVGGDEFCILLQHCQPDIAQKISEQIRKTLDSFLFHWQGKEYNIGISIGLIAIDRSIKSYEEALKLADTSCYIAKEGGRNRIHIHSSSDQAVLERLLQNNIVSQIHDALKNDHFICYTQQICHTNQAKAIHKHNLPCYEVLVRMTDDHKVIPPNQFLPAAERYKLIYKIDHWVIEHAIAKMALIQDKIEWFSINLSGQTIAHESSFEIINRTIKRTEIDPKKICFEVTETAAISDIEVGSKFLKKLRNLGCKIALDDFGTGLSSYEYLKMLPSDILKIDGQFIKNILTEDLDLAMVKSMNEIAHIMGKKTIGEFVESSGVFEKLSEIGLDYGQGYFLEKPKPLVELLNKYSVLP